MTFASTGCNGELAARIQARGVRPAVGALIAAGPAVWRAAVGCVLSASCQSSVIDILEGAAAGAPTSRTHRPGLSE